MENEGENDEILQLARAAYLMVKPAVSQDLSSCQELQQALQYAGFNPSERSVKAHWKAMETMNFRQFCNIVEIEPKPTENSMITAFEKLDTGNLGYIPHTTLTTDLTTRGDKLDMTVVRKLLDNEEYNQDNKFYYPSFCKSVSSTADKFKSLALERLREFDARKEENSRTFRVKKNKSGKSENRVRIMVEEKVIKSPDNFEVRSQILKKGAFYIENNSIISHQYKLKLDRPSSVNLTIKAENRYRFKGGPAVDMDLFLFDEEKRFIGRSSQKRNGFSDWSGDLPKGIYSIIPHTSGARLKKRVKMGDEKTQLINRLPQVSLSQEFLDALHEIFKQIDLDGNGHLSREEFNLFNWRTSGEQVADEEWAVLEENFQLKDGELTLSGFLALHQLEAEECQGNPEELWLTLHSMGFNDQLQQDESVPFTLQTSVTCRGGDTTNALTLSGVKSGGILLEKTIIRSIMDANREPDKVQCTNKAYLYKEVDDTRGAIVIQNKSDKNLTVSLDLSGCRNTITNRSSQLIQISVPKKSPCLALEALPEDPDLSWLLRAVATAVEN